MRLVKIGGGVSLHAMAAGGNTVDLLTVPAGFVARITSFVVVNPDAAGRVMTAGVYDPTLTGPAFCFDRFWADATVGAGATGLDVPERPYGTNAPYFPQIWMKAADRFRFTAAAMTGGNNVEISYTYELWSLY